MPISAAAFTKRENGIKAAQVVRGYYSTKNADGVHQDLRRKFGKLRKEAPPGDEFGEPDHRPCLAPLFTLADMAGLGDRTPFVARFDSSEGERLMKAGSSRVSRRFVVVDISGSMTSAIALLDFGPLVASMVGTWLCVVTFGTDVATVLLVEDTPRGLPSSRGACQWLRSCRVSRACQLCTACHYQEGLPVSTGLPFCTGPAITPRACHHQEGLPSSRGPAIYQEGLPMATGLPLSRGPAIIKRACHYQEGLPLSRGACLALPTSSCTGLGEILLLYYAGLLLNKRTKFPSSGPSCGYMYPVASCH
jgi:hypothetical protein